MTRPDILRPVDIPGGLELLPWALIYEATSTDPRLAVFTNGDRITYVTPPLF